MNNSDFMYISSYHEHMKGKILVWGKNKDLKRVYREFKPIYEFYIPDSGGTFTALTGEKLSKIVCSNKSDFKNKVSQYNTKFESDIKPLDKIMQTFIGQPIFELNKGFIDIEVDYDPTKGFASVTNPYAPINAITLFDSYTKTYITLFVPFDKSFVLPKDMEDDNYLIVDSEKDLLEIFLELYKPIDLVSGWNSYFFDIPYITKRIELILGENYISKMEFEFSPPPTWGEDKPFKESDETNPVVELKSRVQLDYLLLFKKFNLEKRSSYSLAAITDEELDVPKLHYEGTLYDLYRNDPIHFCKYNRHDVKCIVDLEEKFKYIDLATNMVHETTVNYTAIFGTVELVDSAIINFCHTKFNKIVFDKKQIEGKGKKVEGAIVLSPKVGLHKTIGSVDIKSLYPNVFRTINNSPEKIIGQLVNCDEGWHMVRNFTTKQSDGTAILNIKFENIDDIVEMQVSDFVEFLIESKCAFSGYGTIFDQSSGEGLLPAVLSFWFKERIELQGKKKAFYKKAETIIKEKGVKISKDLLLQLGA